MSDVPVGWSVEPFSEVARYASGRTPARADTSYWNEEEAHVPWVAISDMDAYGTVTTTSERVTETAFQEVFRGRLVPAGTLLMSFKLTIGRVATLAIPACHNEAIIAIYPRPGINQSYLAYFLSQVDYADHQDRQIKGNTLNQSKIDRIPILVPPPTEQHEIARVLDLCRKGVDTERRAGQTASELKRAAMEALFARGLRGEPQKETDIGMIPVGWTTKRLEDCAEVLSSRLSYTELEGMRPSASTATETVLGIKVSDMNRLGNEVELRHSALMVPLDRGVVEQRCVPPGTIVFPKRGAAIATNKKRLSTTWTVFDPNVIGVRGRSELDQRFLFHWFQKFDLREITEPGPTPQLNKKNLDPLIIPVPPDMREQCDIVAVLDALDRKIDLHRRKHSLLEEVFKSLLHNLMTGKMRVGEMAVSSLSAQAIQSPGAAT